MTMQGSNESGCLCCEAWSTSTYRMMRAAYGLYTHLPSHFGRVLHLAVEGYQRSGARHLHPFPGHTRAPRRAAARMDPTLRPTGWAAEGAVYSFESATSGTSNVFHARADGNHRLLEATRKC